MVHMPAKRWGVAKVVLALVVAVGLLVVFRLLPVGAYALELVESLRSLGVAGAVLYGAAYVAATLLLVPGSVLTLGAGFAYGLWGGLAVVVPASLLGSVGAFLIGRFLARDWVVRRIDRHPRLRAVDDAIAERSFSVVFLLRLSPVVPFSLLNYFLGITRARLSDYVLASATGMFLGTLLYVYLGSLVTDAAALAVGEGVRPGPWGIALVAGGILATIAVTVWVSSAASKKLEQRLAQS